MKKHHSLLIVVVLALVLALLAAAVQFWPRAAKTQTNVPAAKAAAKTADPPSRQVMLIAEDLVRATKPAPTTAALQYAYVARAYADGLRVGNQSTAVFASQQLLLTLFPERAGEIQSRISSLVAENQLTTITEATVSPSVRASINGLRNRYQFDGHDLVWDGKVPTGSGKWVQTSSVAPFTPRAGDWQRWNVTQPIAVPAPPTPGSAEDRKQIQAVKSASANRNGEDVNIINFWGGVPGTEAPAGIWQNQLYVTVKADLNPDKLAADKAYAEVQSHLAMAISDAFMECWKVKYTYWTARPNMRDASITTAMNNPNFPSYVSGHSTISKAAADLLSVEAPKYSAAWQAMAVEARDSRLKAGIHFPIDNTVGFDVGSAVAQQTVSSLQLQAVL